MACASVITLRTPSLRQSPAGKLRLSETQISIFSPTARSVNSWKPAPPVRMLITGQCFFVPTGGLGTAAAATRARARAGLAAATGLRRRRLDLEVADVNNVAERIARERRCRNAERERRNGQRCHCSSHCFLPLAEVVPCRHGHMADSD